MDLYDTPVDALLHASRNYPLLSAHQEKRLARRARNGDQEATDTMILSNIRLVVSTARRYGDRNGMQFSDLVQEGVVGLMRAVRGFDPDRGWRFSTYATWWIRQAIGRAIANRDSLVRVPIHAQSNAKIAHEGSAQLRQELGREPSQEELVTQLEWTNDQLEKTMNWGRVDRSLDEQGTDDRHWHESLLDPSPDVYEQTEAIEEHDLIERAVEGLDDRSAQIVRLRHGLAQQDPLSLRETGKQVGLSPERVRQLEKNALQRLSHFSELSHWREHESVEAG